MARSSWNKVTSSVIAAYRYDPERRTLQVKSKRTGRVRSYYCTPAQLRGFERAWSKGRFITGLDQLEGRSWRRPRLLPH